MKVQSNRKQFSYLESFIFEEQMGKLLSHPETKDDARKYYERLFWLEDVNRCEAEREYIKIVLERMYTSIK